MRIESCGFLVAKSVSVLVQVEHMLSLLLILLGQPDHALVPAMHSVCHGNFKKQTCEAIAYQSVLDFTEGNVTCSNSSHGDKQ